MSGATQLNEALGVLSREERAFALTACTLMGHQASTLLRFLAPNRAGALGAVIDIAFALPVRERMGALAAQARGLALRPRLDAQVLHPQRYATLVGEARAIGGSLSELYLRALGIEFDDEALATPGARTRPSTRSPAPVALAVIDEVLRQHVTPPPSSDVLRAAPAELRALATASFGRLDAVATALGAARLRAVIEQSPPELGAWIAQRLSPGWDEQLASCEPAPPGEALLALGPMVRAREDAR